MRKIAIFILAFGVVSLICFHQAQAADKIAGPEQRLEAGAGFMKPTLAQDAGDKLLPPGIAGRDEGNIPGEGKHSGWEIGKHKGWGKGPVTIILPFPFEPPEDPGVPKVPIEPPEDIIVLPFEPPEDIIVIPTPVGPIELPDSGVSKVPKVPIDTFVRADMPLYRPGETIVRFAHGVTENEINELLSKLGFHIDNEIGPQDGPHSIYVIGLPTGMSVEEGIKILMETGLVLNAGPNYIEHLDSSDTVNLGDIDKR